MNIYCVNTIALVSNDFIALCIGVRILGKKTSGIKMMVLEFQYLPMRHLILTQCNVNLIVT